MADVADAGGIRATGGLEGFAPVRYAGTDDIAEAMAGAELVIVVGPAYATDGLAEVAGPHLVDGMAVLVCPGSCAGALAFMRAAGLEIGSDRVLVGETSTLPYAVRITGAGRDQRLPQARDRRVPGGDPADRHRAPARARPHVWPAVEQAESVFQTTLQNGNPVIHPAVTLLNAALLERTGGDFLFYEEGVTPVVGRLIEAVDPSGCRSRRALGVSVLSEPEIGVEQGYMTEQLHDGLLRPPRLPRHQGADLGSTTSLPHRGRRLVADPLHRPRRPARRADPGDGCVIPITSVGALARDLRGRRRRTLATLGLDGLTAADLAAL